MEKGLIYNQLKNTCPSVRNDTLLECVNLDDDYWEDFEQLDIMAKLVDESAFK